jgi:crotonobetainyl-CoA:carnitine CoA-transferase CaiB-like acyl-CoA transferase
MTQIALLRREITVPNVGFKLGGMTAFRPAPPPLPFGDTADVLKELGYDEPGIEALVASGAVARRTRPAS